MVSSPVQHSFVPRTVGRGLDVGACGICGAVQHRQIDGVPVGSPAMTYWVHASTVIAVVLSSKGSIAIGVGLAEVICRQHCEGSRPKADRLLIKPKRVGQVGAGIQGTGRTQSTRGMASILESRLLLPAPARSLLPRCQGWRDGRGSRRPRSQRRSGGAGPSRSLGSMSGPTKRAQARSPSPG